MAPEGFAGIPLCRHESAGFAFGSWIATQLADAEHTHADAHFMFIAAGRFLTGLRPSAARSPLIFNPRGTTHRDRFETAAGRFFAISTSVELEDAPLHSLEVGSVAAHALVARLMRECASWDGESAHIAEALCFELVAIACGRRDERKKPKWLTQAAALIGDDRHVSLEQVSREVGVHRTHLTRAFRRFHGCTPAEFARVSRLRRAAAALDKTDAPLADVALSAGFADQSHFTKHFRAAYGVSPGEYRRLSR